MNRRLATTTVATVLPPPMSEDRGVPRLNPASLPLCHHPVVASIPSLVGRAPLVIPLSL